MSATLDLWLNTFPPSADHRNKIGFARAGRGRRFVRPSDETVEFMDLVRRWALKHAVPPRLEGWVVAEKYVCWPDFVRRDTHNLDKVLFDAIEKAGIVQDDRFIIARQMQVRFWPKDPETPRPTFLFYPHVASIELTEWTCEEPGILVRMRAAHGPEIPDAWALERLGQLARVDLV